MADLKVDLDRALTRFAPEVRLHPDDQHRPSSVEWYLERTSLRRWRGPFRKGENVFADGRISAERLGVVAGVEDEDPAGLFLTISDDAARYGFQPTAGNLAAPCYVNARSAPDDPSAFDLQYWFFYPFNGRDGRHIAHEGDWEHITVRVSNTASPELMAAYVSAHGLNNGDWAIPGRGGLQVTETGNPIVYSSLGSHASYTSPGAHKQGWPKSADQTADGGPVWVTSRELVLVEVNGQSLDGDKDTHPWLRYRGRWGAIRKYAWPFSATGPVGPSHQQSWIAEPPLNA